MIDEDLHPWLIEVNASPSLSTTTDKDRIMKMFLVRDILEVVVPRDFSEFFYSLKRKKRTFQSILFLFLLMQFSRSNHTWSLPGYRGILCPV